MEELFYLFYQKKQCKVEGKFKKREDKVKISKKEEKEAKKGRKNFKLLC